MAIASMIVQPSPASVFLVKEELASLGGVTVHSVTEKQEVIVLVEADSLASIERIARDIQAIPGVFGVFPTYITTEDGDESSG
jgi:nitrate reductase NapD